MAQSTKPNLWDYDVLDMLLLGIPSPKDRKELEAPNRISPIGLDMNNRVKIWDYFFRIDPNLVGRKQKDKIKEIKDTQKKLNEGYAAKKFELEREFRKNQNSIQGIREWFKKVINTDSSERQMLINLNLVIGGITLLALCGIIRVADFWQFVVSMFAIANLGFFVIVPVRIAILNTEKRRKLKRELDEQLKSLEERKNIIDDSAKYDIAKLEKEIEILRSQIPTPPRGEDVREWLRRDLEKLQRYYEQQIRIDFEKEKMPAPKLIYGPIELQDPNQWPKIFREASSPEQFFNSLLLNVLEWVKTISKPSDESRTQSQLKALARKLKNSTYDYDLFKHKEAATLNAQDYQTLYVLNGLYFINCMFLGDNRMSIVTLFYDFISGKVISQSTSEVYYKDCVEIKISEEMRKFTRLKSNKSETFDLENSDLLDFEDEVVEGIPTFAIELSNGRRKEITLPNAEYLTVVDETDSLPDSDDITKEKLAKEINDDAMSVFKAIRTRLRLIKQSEFDREDTIIHPLPDTTENFSLSKGRGLNKLIKPQG